MLLNLSAQIAVITQHGFTVHEERLVSLLDKNVMDSLTATTRLMKQTAVSCSASVTVVCLPMLVVVIIIRLYGYCEGLMTIYSRD